MRLSRMAAMAALLICSAPAVAQEVVPAHETFILDSARTAERRVINVYLPPGHGTDATARYPVIYMPDGGVEEDFPHVAATIDQGIRRGEMRQVILVGIENTQRRRDMTGPTQVASDRGIAPQVGGSAAFRAFIGDELIPAIGSRYRASGARGIIGESLAGLFIVETLLLEPSLFDTYIALSPSLWWNDGQLVKASSSTLANRQHRKLAVYVASADEDNITPQVALLRESLRQHAPAGMDWITEEHPDLSHATIYRRLAPALLRRYYPPQTDAP